MIRTDYFIATIMSYPAEFGKFAHAYGSYCGELKKAQNAIQVSVIKDFATVDESLYNPTVTRMINWCAKELFHLDRLCKNARSVGFVEGFVSKEAFEVLINEAYEVVTSLEFKKA